jgi:phosphoribosylformimino-5-aminoimidazole carboxamide ribotide isomerase
VIGVIDLLGGKAVHARGGVRADYRPIRAVAEAAIDEGDASAVMQAYVALGVREAYVADLDAILQGPPQNALLASLASSGVPLWLDAAITSAARARQVREIGVAHVVVGLETLTSFEALRTICQTGGTGPTAFSLDMKEGALLTHPRLRLLDRGPEAVAAHAVAAGAGTVIVLDLARVGSGAGPDLRLLERLRRTVPGVTLLAGGGVRGADDLDRLADVGCDGALVGTALLSGQLAVPRTHNTPGVMSGRTGGH